MNTQPSPEQLEVRKQHPLNPDMIRNGFYENLPPDPTERYFEERAVFTEALQTPESTRMVLECKLEQLAKRLGYATVGDMEADLDVNHQFPEETARRASFLAEEGERVFFHEVSTTDISIEENEIGPFRGKVMRSKGTSRLLWTRKDGELSGLRTNFPQVDHYTIEIGDSDVRTSYVHGTVLLGNELANPSVGKHDYILEYPHQDGSRTVYKMDDRELDAETSARVVMDYFDHHLADDSLKGKISGLLERLRG